MNGRAGGLISSDVEKKGLKKKKDRMIRIRNAERPVVYILARQKEKKKRKMVDEVMSGIPIRGSLTHTYMPHTCYYFYYISHA